MARDVNVKFNLLGDFSKKINESIRDVSTLAKNIHFLHSATQILANGFNVLASGITEPIERSANFQEKMANVASLGVENIDALNSAVLDLSTNLPMENATDDLADGLYNVVSAGVDASNQLHVLELSAKAGKAGIASTTDSLNLGSAIIKAFNADWSEMRNVMDMAFQTVKDGQTTFPELAGSIQKVAPTAASMGVSMEELFSTFSTLTGVVGSASEVATGFKAALSNIAKPTAEAKRLSAELGLEFSMSALKTKGWNKFLTDLRLKTEGSSEKINKLFGSVEAYNTVVALAGSQSDAFTNKLENMSNASGAMENAFRIQSDTINSKIILLKNKFNKTLIDIGNFLQPYVLKTLDMINEAIKTGKQVYKIISDLSPVIGVLAGAFAAWTIATNAQKIAMAGLNAVSQANPFVLIGTAILSIVTAMGFFNRDSETMEDRLVRLKGKMESLGKETTAVNKALARQRREELEEILNEKEEALVSIKEDERVLKYISSIEDAEKKIIELEKTIAEKTLKASESTNNSIKKYYTNQADQASKSIETLTEYILLVNETNEAVENFYKNEDIINGVSSENMAKNESKNEEVEITYKKIEQIELRKKADESETKKYVSEVDKRIKYGSVKAEREIEQINTEKSLWSDYWDWFKLNLKNTFDWENATWEQRIDKIKEGFNVVTSLFDQASSIEEQKRNEKAERDKESLRIETEAKLKALDDDKKNGKISEQQYQSRLQKIQAYEKQQTKEIEQEQKKRSEIEKNAARFRTLMSTYEMATKAYKALVGIPIVGPVLAPIAAAAATAFGMHQLKNINKNKFAEGGLIDKPTLALMGEAGQREFVTPELTFEQKFNELKQDILIGFNQVADKLTLALNKLISPQFARHSGNVSSVNNVNSSTNLIIPIWINAKETVQETFDEIKERLNEEIRSVQGAESVGVEDIESAIGAVIELRGAN